MFTFINIIECYCCCCCLCQNKFVNLYSHSIQLNFELRFIKYVRQCVRAYIKYHFISFHFTLFKSVSRVFCVRACVFIHFRPFKTRFIFAIISISSFVTFFGVIRRKKMCLFVCFTMNMLILMNANTHKCAIVFCKQIKASE